LLFNLPHNLVRSLQRGKRFATPAWPSAWLWVQTPKRPFYFADPEWASALCGMLGFGPTPRVGSLVVFGIV
jgi:hypothetical protein